MTKKAERDNLYESFIEELIKNVDFNESTEWEKETRDVSVNIRQAISEVLDNMNEERKNKAGAYNDEFLNYCNAVKGLLTIYNFGNLPDEKVSGDNSDFASYLQKDKELILTSIKRIIDHVKNGIGYDITPYLPKDECLEIFGVKGNVGKVVPVTFSATTVFTTLVYFRRAVKRLNLFSEAELQTENGNVMNDVVAIVAELMAHFYDYAVHSSKKFSGWGVTLDANVSKAVTLSDTYAVVDALSRFADAFTQSGLKRDRTFTDAIDAYAKEHFGISAITDRCVESTYKTAYNVYMDTREVYGKKKAFYVLTKRDGDKVNYDYNGTDYDQIAASSRSSALFNPLYIAMITMYGYDDKELVIRLFMDDPSLVASYDKKYGPEIAEYAKTLRGYNDEEHKHDFEEDRKRLLANDSKKSTDYALATNETGKEGEVTWRTYYEAARVYQKFLEEKHEEELMEIPVYRDYLNATKDAIDQVAVLYREFENNQRLGVVDTDYVMYSELDVAVKRDDKVSIPKLNKANIAVNSLRPMLLSSKIMIVNALTKYPQSDMRSLYYAIKTKRHQKIKQGKNRTIEKVDEWLWNEDSVDMNSTARHCETIAYDYFDYYEKYELGFTAIRNLRKDLGSNISEDTVNKSDGSYTPTYSAPEGSEDDDSTATGLKRQMLQKLLMELTRQNVELVKGIYQNNLQQKDREIQELKAEKNELIDVHNKDLADKDAEHKREIEKLESIHQDRLRRQQESLFMGDTMRGWIREEIESFFKRNMALAVINTLNIGSKASSMFEERYVQKLCNGEVVDGNFDFVRSVWDDIVADCLIEPAETENKIAKYTQDFKTAIAFRNMLAVACNGILDKDYYAKLAKDSSMPLTERNQRIRTKYNERRYRDKREEDEEVKSFDEDNAPSNT